MRPTAVLVLLFLAALALAFLPIFLGPRLVPAWLATVGGLLLLGGLDAVTGLRRRRLEVAFEAPERIAIGEEADAMLRLSTRATWRRTAVRALLDLEGPVAPPGALFARLGADGRTAVPFPLRPTRRGVLAFHGAWLAWTGPLGLVRRTLRVPLDAETPVVPNIAASRVEAIRLFRRRDAWVGLKTVRHVGEGSEFESLREYVPGLDPRSINWKASARHRELIATDYRDERNHQIVVALDTGHLMGEPVGGIPRLDHASGAALVLAYAGLRHGDRVGAFAFDEGVKDWIEPRGGIQTLSRLQRFVAEARYGTAETNYTLGLAELSARLNRRSMVIVFTEFVDTVTAELMVENAARLARRHLVTFVTLRDPYLSSRIGARPATVSDVYAAIVADDFARERELVRHRLERLGIFCIEATTRDLSSRLVNRYLDVKRRELVG